MSARSASWNSSSAWYGAGMVVSDCVRPWTFTFCAKLTRYPAVPRQHLARSPLADQESVNLCGRWVGAMLYESMSQVGGSPRYVGACSTIPHAVQWVSSATARML